MSKDIIELGAIMRKRQTEQEMKRLAPHIAAIKADFERQLAEKDAEIARIRDESETRLGALVAEQEENDALKGQVSELKREIAAIREAEAESVRAAPRKGRSK